MSLEHSYRAIVIGVSAGGLEALSLILPELPESFALPIIVVQHLCEGRENNIPKYLNSKSSILVKEADEKEVIQPGTVYLAPAGYHLLIETDRSLSLSLDPRVNYARPSIDILFESAADVYEEELIGIILTGANNDGSHGLRKIKQLGGLTIVQDPVTAASDCMPLMAIQATEVDHILALEEIGPFLRRFHSTL